MVAMTIISKTQEYHNLSMISWGGEKGNLNTASKKHVRTDDMQWVAYCSATDTIDRARINANSYLHTSIAFPGFIELIVRGDQPVVRQSKLIVP